MDEKELKETIEKGESERVELEESFDKDALETASAFANARGGTIFIGVNDKREIRGISVGKESLKNWINEISQATEPIVIPEIEKHELYGKTIVSIKIAESPLKPVSYKGLCYLRAGNGNKKLTPKEIADMHLRTTGSSWDSYPAREAKIENIDMEKVKNYIRLANEAGRRKIAEKPLQVLEKLDLIKEGKITWAAILLFGKEPQRFVLQAKIHCGRFKASKMNILDDKMIEGDLIAQIEGAMDFVKKHTSVRFEITGRPRREEIWEYPLQAMREGIINAIVHREYTAPSEIQIEVYDDRIEIWNPGGLPPALRIDDLYKENHKSIPRNKVIAQIFYDAELIEKYGSGTTRMLEICRKSGIVLEFRESSGGLSAIFRKDIYTEEYLKDLVLNERQIKAVLYAKENKRITNKEYQQICNTSERTASRELSDLVKKSVFRQRGITGKGTAYVLAAKDAIKTP